MSKRSRRILLIYPPFLEARLHEEDIRSMPIGVYYLAAALRESGCEVVLLNLNEGRSGPDHALALVERWRPAVVGFSILNANRWGGIELARRIKDRDPAIVTVFGGIGASTLWEHLLTHFAAVDYVMIGEGERTFPALQRWLEETPGADPGHLGGVAFRRQGRPVRTPCDPLIADLDALPDPTRHYTYPHLALTRGCPANCRFCGSPGIWQRQVRWHSPAYFVDQMARLASRGVTFVHVCDDTFTLRKATVLAVCRAIMARKLTMHWSAISRVDTVDEEILSWMRRAGCIQISYGIESANRDVRRFLNKQIRLRDVRAAFAATRRCGILPRAYFIYGCPGDSWPTMQENIDLMAAIKPLGAIFYILDIYPGTQLYQDYLKRSGKNDDLWLAPIEDILYCETDPDMDPGTVRAYGHFLRTGFYRMLPSFAENIELTDEPSFYPLHADFLSRLAMTFHKGDYARIAAIPDKRRTAEGLYRRALAFHPDARAFLGLGLLCQQRGALAAAADLLEQGLAHFPQHEDLQTCMAVNEMNQGAFAAALKRLRSLRQTPQIRELMAHCRKAPPS